MRAILTVAIAAIFVLVLRNYSMSGDAGPNVAQSIDPFAMTLNAGDMPTQQFVGP
jgi:hypothetical protein